MRLTNTQFLIAAGLLSLFTPSSVAGTIIPSLSIVACGLAAAFLGASVRQSSAAKLNLPLVFLVFALLFSFSLTSPLHQLALGGLAPYILMGAVLLSSIPKHTEKSTARLGLLVVNSIIFWMAFGLLLGDTASTDIQEKYFKAFDDEIFEMLVTWNIKPISVFASHSTAAFAYFALFLLNWRRASFERQNKAWKLFFEISSLSYVFLLPWLASNTGLLLFAIALILIIYRISRNLKVGLTAISILLAVAQVSGVLNEVRAASSDVFDFIDRIVSFEGGGLLGRYTGESRLKPTYDYLVSHNFLPIGLTYSPEIALGDNFIAEYIIKVSLVGYLAILVATWNWLSHSLQQQRHAVGFFAFLLAADFAYPLLVFPRIAGFLPLFVLLWNCSEPEIDTSPARQSGQLSRPPCVTQ